MLDSSVKIHTKGSKQTKRLGKEWQSDSGVGWGRFTRELKRISYGTINHFSRNNPATYLYISMTDVFVFSYSNLSLSNVPFLCYVTPLKIPTPHHQLVFTSKYNEIYLIIYWVWWPLQPNTLYLSLPIYVHSNDRFIYIVSIVYFFSDRPVHITLKTKLSTIKTRVNLLFIYFLNLCFYNFIY